MHFDKREGVFADDPQRHSTLLCFLASVAMLVPDFMGQREEAVVRAYRWAVFVGLGVLVVATPISFIFINKLTNLQEDMLAHTDRRIALVNQLLAGMKSLKMYAWEAAQEARVISPDTVTSGV